MLGGVATFLKHKITSKNKVMEENSGGCLLVYTIGIGLEAKIEEHVSIINVLMVGK